MSDSAPQRLATEALALPPAAREDLALRLIESLGSEADLSQEWMQLIRRRIEDVATDASRTVSRDDALLTASRRIE